MVGFVELPVDYVWQTGQETVSRENLLRHASEKEGGYVEFFVQKNSDICLDVPLRAGAIGPYLVYNIRMPATMLALGPMDWHYGQGKI